MKTAVLLLVLLLAVFAAAQAPATAAAAAPAAPAAAPAAPAAAPAAPAAAAPAPAAPAAKQAAAPAQKETPKILAGPKPVVREGVTLYPVQVVDPNAPTHVVLPDGSIAGVPSLPAEAVTDLHALPPIPVLSPRHHRRALRRVSKSLGLLDRAHDALTAHLAQLATMRAKVQDKLEHLRAEQLKHGYVLLPEPGATVSPNAPLEVRHLLRQYLMSALETKNGEHTEAHSAVEAGAEAGAEAAAETEGAAETEAAAETETATEATAEAGAEVETEEAETVDMDVSPAQIVALIEQAAEAELDLDLEAEADAEVEMENEGEVETEEQEAEAQEAEAEAEAEAEETAQ